MASSSDPGSNGPIFEPGSGTKRPLHTGNRAQSSLTNSDSIFPRGVLRPSFLTKSLLVYGQVQQASHANTPALPCQQGLTCRHTRPLMPARQLSDPPPLRSSELDTRPSEREEHSVMFYFFNIGSLYVTQASLKLIILLP